MSCVTLSAHVVQAGSAAPKESPTGKMSAVLDAPCRRPQPSGLLPACQFTSANQNSPSAAALSCLQLTARKQFQQSENHVAQHRPAPPHPGSVRGVRSLEACLSGCSRRCWHKSRRSPPSVCVFPATCPHSRLSSQAKVPLSPETFAAEYEFV